VLVPGVLALLPEYAGLEDPVAELRAACLDAVGWAAKEGPVDVLASKQGARVAAALLAHGGFEARARGALAPQPPVVVVGNGSAKRRDTSPGYVDERAIAFDADLGARLRSGELSGIDAALARELWADTEAIARLDGVLPPGGACTVDYEDDPYGVQYWVARWEW
jgi:hypothetical protein